MRQEGLGGRGGALQWQAGGRSGDWGGSVCVCIAFIHSCMQTRVVVVRSAFVHPYTTHTHLRRRPCPARLGVVQIAPLAALQRVLQREAGGADAAHQLRRRCSGERGWGKGWVDGWTGDSTERQIKRVCACGGRPTARQDGRTFVPRTTRRSTTRLISRLICRVREEDLSGGSTLDIMICRGGWGGREE